MRAPEEAQVASGSIAEPGQESEAAEERAAGDGTQPADRRRSFRLNRVLGAELEHGGEVMRARLFVIDISTTGFRATNHSALPVQEELGVSISLAAGQEPIEGRARVVWQKELSLSGMYQCGFEFLELPEESCQRLEEFIEAEKQKTAVQYEVPYLGRPWTTLH